MSEEAIYRLRIKLAQARLNYDKHALAAAQAEWALNAYGNEIACIESDLARRISSNNPN